MRVSRPCYDKLHRCPGWAGGGMKYARKAGCDNGHLPRDLYDRRLWRWRPHRCTTCRLVVLPSHVRWVDPSWWAYWAPSRLRVREWRRRR